jgi:gamma-glutamyltranspeptidase/glutathione hydrolase
MRIHRLLLSFVAILATGGSALVGQQQAAEAPASARPALTRPAVAGLNGLVTTGHPIASSAGLQMLLKGGNAFDAAAAVGAMAALGEPEMNGIGGNGFMTIFHKETGKVWSLSMAGAAPKKLVASEMTPETLNAGMKAGIVPGNLGGYLEQLQRYGTMSVGEVFAPAIEYAEKGYPIDVMLAQSIARGRNNLSKYPTSAKIFLPNGEPLKAGELLKNPDYAATLRKLVEAEAQAKAKGASRSAAIQAAYDRFYKGDIAQEFDRFFRENGGVLTAADLAAYKPVWQEPLHTRYRGHDVYSNPATSRGGFEVLMGANLIEAVDLKAAGPGSAAALHAVIESIKISKADIYRYVADPAFVKVPTAGLLSREFAATRRVLFDPSRAIPYPPAGTPDGTPTSSPRAAGPAFADRYDGELHTTSFSVVDRFGNAVGCTPTLGGLFGNNVVVGSTGLLLNNGMRLGSTSPYPTDVNYVGAGKIPILNNSPVVVLKDGALSYVFGTPGGETIGQTEFQVLLNLIDFEMPVQQAIEAPRLALDAKPNFYKPGAEIVVQIEGRVPPATVAAL